MGLKAINMVDSVLWNLSKHIFPYSKFNYI